MKKLIEIPDEILQDLKILAVKSNKDLKNFIQNELKKLVQNNEVLPCGNESLPPYVQWVTGLLTVRYGMTDVNNLEVAAEIVKFCSNKQRDLKLVGSIDEKASSEVKNAWRKNMIERQNLDERQSQQLNLAGIRRSYLLTIGCGINYIHNEGTHYTSGKLCADCGRFIKKGTLEYFMTLGVFDIWRAVHNEGVKSKRGLCKELKVLLEKLDNRGQLLKMTEEEAKDFMSETYKLLGKYKILYTDACKMLF